MAKNLFGLVHTFLDNDGTLEVGGTIEVYQAGTSTAQTVYSDRGLTTTAGYQITADASGRLPERWIADTTLVKLVYKSASGSTLATRDYANDNPPVVFGAGWVTALENTIPWRTPIGLVLDTNTTGARSTNTSALQTCIDIGPGRIVLPVGTIYYNDDLDLTAAERIIIEGAGQGTILLSVTTGGIGIKIGDGSDNPRLMVLRDFQVGFTTSQSTNAFFDLDNANEVRIQRIGLISNAKTWFRIAGGAAQYNTWIEGCTPYGGANYAYLIDNAQGVVIKDVLGASLTEGGITFVECSGCYMEDVDMAGITGNAFSTFPGVGQVVKAVFATRCFGDTCTGYGWFISTNGGTVADINLTQCWGATCTEDGILVDGGTGTVNGVQIIGFKATNNQKRGIRIEKASNVTIDSPSCTSNSQAGSATYDGIVIGASAVDVSISGGVSGSGGAFATNYQRYGINVTSGATGTRLDLDSIDLSGNVTDILANGDPSTIIAGGRYNVRWWGARGDNTNDDTAEIQAAEAFCNANSGGTVYLPEGIYKISDDITSHLGVFWEGDGAAQSIIRQSGATKNGIVYSPGSLSNGGGGIHKLTIEAGTGWDAGGDQGTGSSGTGLIVKNSNDGFRGSNFNINNFTNGISDEYSWYPQFDNFQILYFAGTAIGMPASAAGVGAGGSYTNAKVSNNGFTGVNTASIGINERSGGGRFFRNLDITSCNKGVVVDPPATYQVAYSSYDQVLCDSTVSDAWTIDGTRAVVALEAVECWGAFATSGAGLVTKGSLLDGFQWTGGRLRENGKAGWDHQGGANVHVSMAHIAANSQSSSLTYAGVEVAANVSDWSLIGSRVGNFASSSGADQGNGVTIAAGTSTDFRIALNDFNDQGAGKVAISNGSSADRNTYEISANLPRGSSGNNKQRHILIPLVSTGAVAAGSTVFLGVGGSSATEGDVFHLVDDPGVITEVYIENATAPGAAQTFTYTVRVTGADTTMTGTSSGAASFITTINTNQQTLSRRNRVSVKVVASAGAASSFIRGTLRIEY